MYVNRVLIGLSCFISTLLANTNSSCKPGFYYDPNTRNCHPCSDCSDGRSGNIYCKRACEGEAVDVFLILLSCKLSVNRSLRWIFDAIWLCYLYSYAFIVRQHTDTRYWCSNSVRLSVSVCPSRSVLDENGLTYCHNFFIIHSNHSSFRPFILSIRPIILVLPASNIFAKFRRDHTLRGR